MNPQETLQAFARDEKWVPFDERDKINSTNIRLETTVPQKEETFQLVIDIIKNSTTILNIYPRVEGKDFTDVSDDETALTFLLDLGYKGPLNRHTNIFVDHMHQPWRTLAAIINKCLSGKTASNDTLRIPGLTYCGGCLTEKMSIILNLFGKTLLTKLITGKKRDQGHFYKIKDDGIVSRLKFFRIGEDYQEYGHPIPDVMLTDAIKHSESYKMFIKYSTNQIPPKKSIGKGSKGKKTTKESQETVDVSEEYEPEPKPAKKKTARRRVVKKKVTLSADDNIISDDPDVALELDKSISQTKVEAARKLHAIHARIVTESAKKKFGGRSSKSVVIEDTLSASKSKPATSKAKLKGALSLTPVEQEAANIMQALKERVPDKSKVISATSSEGTGAKPGVLDEDKDIIEEKVILEWEDEQDSEHFNDDEKDGDADDESDDHVSDKQDDDDEDDQTESDEDDIYKYKIRVRKDEDVEMKDAEVEGSDKGDEEITDAAKEEAEKTLEAKDDTKKSELPPSSLSLFVSSDLSSLLDIPIQHETPQIESPLVHKIPVSVIPETTNLLPIPEIVTKTLVTTADPSPQHLRELTKKLTPTTKQESEKSPSEILKIKKEKV
ncbi:hypothetical protein Tco_1002045 [Tanacetum coccineum]|uniref:Uncharacterized protein n=1 Tax=Tanacetum coccineum TaxID=301880 RepID=A0ABQ5F709_9ASTR